MEQPNTEPQRFWAILPVRDHRAFALEQAMVPITVLISRFPPVRKLCLALLALAWLPQAVAQERIYRCGNEYTNSPTPDQRKDCRLLEGGNITVVQGTKVQSGGGAKPAPAPSTGTGAPASSADQPRVDPAQQRARDSDARLILEAELKRAEAKLAELQREYQGGEVERRGDEVRNHGRYTTRVAELKASVARAESDVAGIKRELARAAPVAAVR